MTTLIDSVGQLPGARRWTCSAGLIRIHLLVLPVPLKWIVSETRDGGIKAALVDPALINLVAFL